jgi:hypothetical protein
MNLSRLFSDYSRRGNQTAAQKPFNLTSLRLSSDPLSAVPEYLGGY